MTYCARFIWRNGAGDWPQTPGLNAGVDTLHYESCMSSSPAPIACHPGWAATLATTHACFETGSAPIRPSSPDRSSPSRRPPRSRTPPTRAQPILKPRPTSSIKWRCQRRIIGPAQAAQRERPPFILVGQDRRQARLTDLSSGQTRSNATPETPFLQIGRAKRQASLDGVGPSPKLSLEDAAALWCRR